MDITSPKFLSSSLNQGAQSPVLSPIQRSQLQNKTSTQTDTQSPVTQPIDQAALTLSRAIALRESSKDGQTPNYTASGDAGTSYGAYQWNNGKQPLQPGQLPTNFVNAAKQYGLDPTDFSPENQDKVAYAQVKALKDQGLQPEQIAASWNAGMGHINDWQNHVGTTEINGQQVHYDTPAYVKQVQQYYQQLSQNVPQQTQTQNPSMQNGTPESPSLGGFLGNVVSSGANFVGNVGNALLHPIQTVQNVGGAAVGGVQELGGQQNENTAKFDNLVGYFKQRYGGVDNLLHTAYTDPVGLAADISTVLGVGGGVAGAVSKVGELGSVESLAEGAGAISKGLGVASELTNPLTPIVKGAGAVLNKTKDLSDIIANPQSYTPEEIANSSGEKIANDVQSAFDARRAELSDTGSAYNPLRETPTTITVAPNFLDQTFREIGKLNVDDGVISADSHSLIRDVSDINELQRIYNLYKPNFLNGKISSDEFLNLRKDLADTANYSKGLSTNIQSVADKIRTSLNDSYRDQVPSLTETDANYSSQLNNIKELEDDMVYKTGLNKGELKDSFINKASKAFKTGNTEDLTKLEEIVPGITKRLQIMKTMKDLGNPSFTTSLVEKGGVVGGLLSGNIKGAAVALTSIILSKPEIAVPLLRAIGSNMELVKAVMANLAKSATISSVGNNAVSQSPQSTEVPQNTDQSLQQEPLPQQENQSPQIQNDSSSLNITNNIEQLAQSKHFDLTKARNAGYSDKEISDFLNTQK